jgi:RNase H-fold protein (predicted Holliday junction resolvase)
MLVSEDFASTMFSESDHVPDQPVILGFDPGKSKCGLAVMGVDRRLHYHQIVASADAIATIQSLRQQFPISLLVMGDQTTAKNWQQKLTSELDDPLRIILVDERYSTLQARDRYWQMYPPKGLNSERNAQPRSSDRRHRGNSAY